MDKIAVLIPCFNEAGTIEKVVTDFRRVLPGAIVYVYDNNSTDDTAILAERAGAVVRKERLQGKGNVIRRMFSEIDARVYLMVDGDDTYPAEYAPAMADFVLHHQSDMVIGDRLSGTYYTENKRPFHNFGNSFMQKRINALFGSDIRDILTGYRAFSYRFVKTFPVLSQGFEIETEMTIQAIDKNMVIDNVVIDYRNRPEGSESKLSTIKDGLKVIMTMQRMYRNYRPLKYFGKRSFVLAALSIGFFLPVLGDWFETGLVERFPTLIVCGFSFMAAIMSLFCGILLDTIRQKNRQDFEHELTRVEESYREL